MLARTTWARRGASGLPAAKPPIGPVAKPNGRFALGQGRRAANAGTMAMLGFHPCKSSRLILRLAPGPVSSPPSRCSPRNTCGCRLWTTARCVPTPAARACAADRLGHRDNPRPGTIGGSAVGRDRGAAAGEPVSKTVPLPMPRQDIADFLTLTFETISRTLTKFEERKTIQILPREVLLTGLERTHLVKFQQPRYGRRKTYTRIGDLAALGQRRSFNAPRAMPRATDSPRVRPSSATSPGGNLPTPSYEACCGSLVGLFSVGNTLSYFARASLMRRARSSSDFGINRTTSPMRLSKSKIRRHRWL